ncbi:MAG: molybdenum cofactor biosynthesis protein MoaB [Deltaproteobacteria bacterium]|nr:molybdenum cofactor biosynthesis protein MoaB [Deltaproteobacteria bacterium]
MGTKEHKARAPRFLQIAVLSVSSTRSLAEDKSGHWIVKRAKKKGHEVVFHEVVRDHKVIIEDTVKRIIETCNPHAIVATGGTGISPRDVTIEAVRPLFDKELTAFGPLFTYLSYQDIDAAALLSRATAGVVGRTLVFCLPGSLNACKLACNELIFPELGHLVQHSLFG